MTRPKIKQVRARQEESEDFKIVRTNLLGTGFDAGEMHCCARGNDRQNKPGASAVEMLGKLRTQGLVSLESPGSYAARCAGIGIPQLDARGFPGFFFW